MADDSDLTFIKILHYYYLAKFYNLVEVYVMVTCPTLIGQNTTLILILSRGGATTAREILVPEGQHNNLQQARASKTGTSKSPFWLVK